MTDIVSNLNGRSAVTDVGAAEVKRIVRSKTESAKLYRKVYGYKTCVAAKMTGSVTNIASDAEFMPALEAAGDKLVVVDCFATW